MRSFTTVMSLLLRSRSQRANLLQLTLGIISTHLRCPPQLYLILQRLHLVMYQTSVHKAISELSQSTLDKIESVVFSFGNRFFFVLSLACLLLFKIRFRLADLHCVCLAMLHCSLQDGLKDFMTDGMHLILSMDNLDKKIMEHHRRRLTDAHLGSDCSLL